MEEQAQELDRVTRENALFENQQKQLERLIANKLKE
jgi:hypothetical protein